MTQRKANATVLCYTYEAFLAEVETGSVVRVTDRIEQRAGGGTHPGTTRWAIVLTGKNQQGDVAAARFVIGTELTPFAEMNGPTHRDNTGRALDIVLEDLHERGKVADEL
jgi:hypothetical protein